MDLTESKIESRNCKNVKKRKKERKKKVISGANIFELKESKVAEIGDGAVSRFDGNDELRQLHRLRP